MKKSLAGCRSVLDLGCGNASPLKYCEIEYSLGVDDFDRYIEESRNKRIHTKYMKANITEVDFDNNSFDAAIALEVLEHLKKEKGYGLLSKMEKWAKKKVIISVPNGFVAQEDYDSNPLQRHISVWAVDDFKKLGYKVYGFHGYKKLRGHLSEVNFKPVFFWERVSDLTQLIVYFLPKHAFQFYAVKNLKKIDNI